MWHSSRRLYGHSERRQDAVTFPSFYIYETYSKNGNLLFTSLFILFFHFPLNEKYSPKNILHILLYFRYPECLNLWLKYQAPSPILIGFPCWQFHFFRAVLGFCLVLELLLPDTEKEQSGQTGMAFSVMSLNCLHSPGPRLSSCSLHACSKLLYCKSLHWNCNCLCTSLLVFTSMAFFLLWLAFHSFYTDNHQISSRNLIKFFGHQYYAFLIASTVTSLY